MNGQAASRKMRAGALAVALLAALVVEGPAAADDHEVPGSTTSDAVVLGWNAIAVETIGGSVLPFPAARIMATVQAAVFEAVNAITGDYEPYLGTVTAPAGASAEAAAIAAAHGALDAFFPDGERLDQERADWLAAIPDGQAKDDGIRVGEAAAAAMVSDRTGDGSAPPQFHTPQSSEPYEWQITSPGCPPAGGAFKHWRTVKPFGTESSSQFRAEPPPTLTSNRYARDFEEVQAVGDANSMQRSQDRADVARLYAAAPAHHAWNGVARQIASTRSDDIARTARTLAVMNMSVHDSFITVFESKYFYRTWRPVTAIPRGAEDGNRRTVEGPFTPYLVTPCFPGYPSAHGSAAGAASEVLTGAYGGDGHSVTVSHPAAPGVTVRYNDLQTINDDISDARVYGGIHFRVDQDRGERQGERIGRYNDRNVLRPVHDSGSDSYSD